MSAAPSDGTERLQGTDVSGADDFTTSDMQLAAHLMALGHTLARLSGTAARRQFVFTGVPPDAVAAYHHDGQPVSPHDLFRSYRQLKHLVFGTH